MGDSGEFTRILQGSHMPLEKHHSDGHKWHWVFQCDCGNTVVKQGTKVKQEIRRGGTPNCGCATKHLISKKKTLHGKTNHPLYWIWRSMKARCLNPNHKAYKNYGGRGIQVCDRWLEFQNFWNDVSPSYSCGMDLDRINNNDGYYPENVQWVSREVNCNNKRTSVRVMLRGKEWTIRELSETFNIGVSTLWYRLSRGVTGEQLVRKPDVTLKFTTS